MQPTVGKKAPAFTAKNQDGQSVKLSQYLGTKLAIYFYPADNTPTCTVQACNLRDNFSELKKAGITIIGVSPDGEKSHQKFSGKFDLPFPLIADEQNELAIKYGVWGPKKFMGRDYIGLHRTTFLIDEKGVLVGIIAKPKSKEHAAEIISAFAVMG